MRNLAMNAGPAGLLLGVGALAVLLACGGGAQNAAAPSGPSAPATSASTLAYTNPAGAGYRLVRDEASSTSNHLVLDLVGPAGASILGGVFSFSADGARTVWGNPGGADPYLLQGGALNLGTSPRLLKSQLSGSTLQAAIFQKGAASPATLGAAPILSVELDLKPGAATGAVALSSPAAQILDGAGTTQMVAVATGSLSAQ